MGNEPNDPLEIPAFLRRDSENRAEFMKMSEAVESEVTSEPVKKPAKVKTNGAAKPKAAVKAASKPKAKVAKPAKVKAKAAKAPAKAKVAKPKAESKAEKDAYGLRKGSSKSKAAALYARKSGATLEEVKEAVGSIQLNVLKDLEEEGYTVDKKKDQRDGQRPVTRYFLKSKK